MRVLHLIDSLAPAGAERSLAAMAPLLVAAGVHLDVGTFSARRGLQDVLREAGASVVELPRPTRGGRARAAAGLIRSLRPDLVHTTLFEADIAGRLAAVATGVPVVSTWASVAYGPEHLASPGLQPWRVRGAHAVDAATARAVRRFHAVSHHVAEVMGRRLGVRSSKVEVVHRGRDPVTLGRRSPERQAAARVGLGVDTETLVVAIARHEHAKGLDVLLDAWPVVRAGRPAARLVVAGREGEQTAALRAQAARLGIEGSVTLLGTRDDVADLLCAADVFVLPSRWEGLPGALVEAMALEVPVVASAIPPVHEVVDTHALLVPAGDAEALGRAVVEAVCDPEASTRRVAGARARFEAAFTIEVAARGMVAFYERALRR